MRPDAEFSVTGGRSTRSGCYHLSFRSGSRASGACARAAHAYITRSDEYDDAERDAAVYTESDHMPAWAQDDPREYWDAADLYERANGRLYVSADFALPRDLSEEDEVALARSFAQELTAEERLPYTLAIHAGRDADGHEHNPHAHLMITVECEHRPRRMRREETKYDVRYLRGHYLIYLTIANEPRAVSAQRRVGSIRRLARWSLGGAAQERARSASSSLTSGQS
jgi:MobA/MobL family